MTATLSATAATAMRMMKDENDLELLKAILRTMKSSVFNQWILRVNNDVYN